MKCERSSARLRLALHNYEQDELNTSVMRQINPCIVPSRYYILDKYL